MGVAPRFPATTSMASRRLAELFREKTLLGRHYPHGTTTLKAGTLRWTGEVQPSEISNPYLVGLRYAPPKHPHVIVRHPELIVDADGHLPHSYQDGSLCLYKPGQWAHGDRIATTILPWTCEWLLHYEFWRATGEWCGSGGDHAGPVDRPTKRPKNHSGRRGKARAGRRIVAN